MANSHFGQGNRQTNADPYLCLLHCSQPILQSHLQLCSKLSVAAYPLLSALISCRSLRTTHPTVLTFTHLFSLASSSRKSSLETHRTLRPGKQLGQLQTFTFPSTSSNSILLSHSLADRLLQPLLPLCSYHRQVIQTFLSKPSSLHSLLISAPSSKRFFLGTQRKQQGSLQIIVLSLLSCQSKLVISPHLYRTPSAVVSPSSPTPSPAYYKIFLSSFPLHSSCYISPDSRRLSVQSSRQIYQRNTQLN